MQKIQHFFVELLRRKVARLLCAYVAVFWLLAQGFSTIYPVIGLPVWSVQLFIIAGIAFIPVIGFLSWKYNIAPPRIVKDAQDVESVNPNLVWALRRHDAAEAGYILLNWQLGDGKANEKRFFKAFSLGRGPDNEVQLVDQRVSRHHAVFWAENGEWQVRDNSTNGTYLNHVRLAAPTQLPHRCELQFHPAGPVVGVCIDKPAQTMVS